MHFHEVRDVIDLAELVRERPGSGHRRSVAPLRAADVRKLGLEALQDDRVIESDRPFDPLRVGWT
jgi:hypothetical protein